MPVSNEHLNGMCQVWDGLTFSMMKATEAKKAQKAGTLQIATNLQAKDLKRPDEFQTKVEAPEPPAPKTSARKKRTYKTREMKAET